MAKKKPFKLPRVAPLQRIRTEPITDPAEQAALDQVYKEYKQAQREMEAKLARKAAERAANARAKKRK